MDEQQSVVRRGLRLIARYIRGQPLPFTISVAGATVYAISAVGTTVVLGRVTDALIIPAFEGDDVDGAVVGSLVALLCVTFLRALSIVMRRYFGAMTGRRTQATLRRGVVDRYLDVPLSYHQSRPTGQLLAHADNDIEAATEIIYPLPFTVGVIALIAFSLVSLLLVDPYLTLVALLLFPSLAVLNRVYTSRVEQPAADVQHAVGRVSAVAHESIDGALVVKTLGREADEVARLERVADELRQARVRVGRIRTSFEPGIDAIPNLGIVALLAVGSWEISTGRISTGDLVQAMALFGLLAFPVRVVGLSSRRCPDRWSRSPASTRCSPSRRLRSRPTSAGSCCRPGRSTWSSTPSRTGTTALGCSTGATCGSRPGRSSPWSAPRARASPPSPTC